MNSNTNIRCESLTKRGNLCQRNCVIGLQTCRLHLKWKGECSICMESKLNWELKCGHRFHRKCFEQWKRIARTKGQDVTCPLCRSIEMKRYKHTEEPNIEVLTMLLQMLLPFPAQMLDQMAQNLLSQLNT
jgi:Ring finger domain